MGKASLRLGKPGTVSETMARVHTAVAVVLVVAVPLVPLGFWIYARAASVERGSQVMYAQQLLADIAPPLRGARNLGFQVYAERAWAGENLVPISSYTVETHAGTSARPASTARRRRYATR